MTESTQEEVSARIKERDAHLDIRAISKTAEGRRFFKYLLREFDPIFLPAVGLDAELMQEGMGFRRACIAFYELISHADPEMAAQLITENTKEKYADAAREQARGK